MEPTPYQRDVSDGHVRKLVLAMDRMKRYLDPVIAVRSSDGTYLTPNGNHRLTALRELKAKTILALVMPEPRVAYQILAMNIEKAHNLREKALEVHRMYLELAKLDGSAKESDYVLEFEEPHLITLGFCYEERGRFSGGAYQHAVKKVDGFLGQTLERGLKSRQEKAALLLELDDAVVAAVTALKAKGLESPYLKSFVVSRINPLRFIKGDLPSFEELMRTMTKRAKGMKVDRISPQDVSRSGGVLEEEG